MNAIVPRLKLQVKADGKPVKDMVFSEFPVLFGRGSDCHVKLSQFSFLSKVHGSISVQENTILVHDLESRNGIKRDGKKVVQASFDGGGQFEVGGLTFEFSLGEETVLTDIEIPKPWQEKTTPVIRVPVRDKSAGGNEDQREGGVTLELDAQAQTAKADEICIQGVLTWMGDVFDIRQFYAGDHIRVGPHPTEPIFIPTYLHQVIFGRMNKGQAQFGLRQKASWRITEQNRIVNESDLRAKGQVTRTGDLTTFKLERGQILSIRVGHDFEFHLRYIKVPQMLVLKTWIENKEVFIRAAKISLAAHVVLAVLLSFSAPKSHAPKIDNVPTRFAKLLVEPPKQVFAPPPPKVEPPPEPPKEVVKLEEPPPKPKVEEIKKPIPPKVVKKKKAKPQPVVAAKPVKQPSRAPAAVKEASSAPVAPPAPPKNEMLDSFANAFEATPGPKAATMNAKNIQITKTASADPAVSPSDLMKTIKSQTGKLAASGGTSVTSTKVGSVGFAVGGMSGKAGQQGVKAQVVGKPSFEEPAGEQGLDQKQIMKVVKQYVQAIQQCYERSLLDNPNLSGRIEFSWSISAVGKVSEAQVKRSEVTNGEGLSQCVIKLIEGMQFPKAKNGQSTEATIGFPFGKN